MTAVLAGHQARHRIAGAVGPALQLRARPATRRRTRRARGLWQLTRALAMPAVALALMVLVVLLAAR